MRRLAAAFVLLVIVLAVLLGLRLRAQEQALSGPPRGSGEIEADAIDLTTRLSTRIEAVEVREGDPVKQGELLLRLDCLDAEAALAEARARQATAEAQAEAARAAVASARRNRRAAESSQGAAQAQVGALAAQAEAARRQADRLDALATSVAAATRDQARAQADQLGHQVEAARAQATAGADQVRAAEGAIEAARAQQAAAASGARAAQAAVSRAELLTRECEVRAPRDAVVSTLPHEVGELVAPGAVLVRLLDLSEVTATFYLPNAELAAVRPGAPAEVVADAWPEETFRGRVRTVAFEAEFTPRNIQTRTDRDRLVYPVEVVVENPAGRLRPGMPVEVTLLAEEATP